MPEGEEMFYYHGYSGPCPKPPLKKEKEVQPKSEKKIEKIDEASFSRAGRDERLAMTALKINEIIDYLNEPTASCPPHDFADFVYTQPWAGSVPPPNKKCKKCLLETHF